MSLSDLFGKSDREKRLEAQNEKLGYYFELYLDQENYHHQLLYAAMPDHFMENKEFLQQILDQMIKSNEVHYNEYLQDLIEKFTASI